MKKKKITKPVVVNIEQKTESFLYTFSVITKMNGIGVSQTISDTIVSVRAKNPIEAFEKMAKVLDY